MKIRLTSLRIALLPSLLLFGCKAAEKARMFNYLSLLQKSVFSSPPRKRGSISPRIYWIPAFAGMTDLAFLFFLQEAHLKAIRTLAFIRG